MASVGIREKLKDDERSRIVRQERERAAETAQTAVREAGLSEETVEEVKSRILGVS